MCRLSENLTTSASWNPQSLSRPVQGLPYLYLFTHAKEMSAYLQVTFAEITACLTAGSEVRVQKLTVPQPVEKRSAFYKTPSLITVVITARQLSLFWPRLIQSKSSHLPKINYTASIVQRPRGQRSSHNTLKGTETKWNEGGKYQQILFV
jgi:hypothetical protein